MNKGLLDEPVFAFRLGTSEEDGGEATFGGIDSSAYKGKLTYAPVRRKAYWEVELGKIAFGDDELELENTGAAIDTGKPVPINTSLNDIVMRSFPGTSLIALPTDIAEMLNTQIGAKKSWNGQYTVDCNTVPGLPDLTLYLGGKPYPLKATDYILNVQGSCLSAFTAMDINLPDGGRIWIIGERLIHDRTTCVASANGFPVQVTSSSVATTQFMISVTTLLDLLKLPKFFHFLSTHFAPPCNGRYYCILAIPSIVLSPTLPNGSERSIDLTHRGTGTVKRCGDVALSRWSRAESHEGDSGSGAEPIARKGTNMGTVRGLTGSAVRPYPRMHWAHCATVGNTYRARLISSRLLRHVSPLLCTAALCVHLYFRSQAAVPSSNRTVFLGSQYNQVTTDPALCDSITALSTGFIASCAVDPIPFIYKSYLARPQLLPSLKHPRTTHSHHLQWPDKLSPSPHPSSRPSLRSRSSSSSLPSHLSQSPSLPFPIPRLRHIHKHPYHPPPGPSRPPPTMYCYHHTHFLL